ncbi:hypothetical protein HDU96_002761 [Phlyctochytrium bullatum]|nr:hypothetical protein HDU96_002761 [Phlyctochytrium bullatum]
MGRWYHLQPTKIPGYLLLHAAEIMNFFQKDSVGSLLAKIGKEREKIDDVESKIQELETKRQKAVEEIQGLKLIHEYESGKTALAQERQRATAALAEANVVEQSLESRLQEARRSNADNEEKVAKLAVMVQMQDDRMARMRERASRAFFGVGGDFGPKAFMGSGGFIVDPSLIGRRTVERVGVLDAEHAAGTRVLDSRWLEAWVGTMRQRAVEMQGRLMETMAKLDRAKRSGEFELKLVEWAEVVEQLEVIEAAHHQLRMQLHRLEVEEGILKPQSEFLAVTDDLLTQYSMNLSELNQKILRVYGDHKAFVEGTEMHM